MITFIALLSIAIFVVYLFLVLAIVYNGLTKENHIANFFKKKIDNLKQYFKIKTNNPTEKEQ